MSEDSFYLDALTREDCERVRQWRNADPSCLRTPFLLTQEMQADFYERIVCDRNSPDRYWAVRRHDFVAMAGLTGIEWENGRGEISLTIRPDMQGKGVGAASVQLVLEEAFLRMRLETVQGECYECNLALEFWKRIIARYNGAGVTVPRRKWWDGKLWDAWHFTITAEGFQASIEKEKQ